MGLRRARLGHVVAVVTTSAERGLTRLGGRLVTRRVRSSRGGRAVDRRGRRVMFQDERSEEFLLRATRRRREVPRGCGRVVMRGRERREAVSRREQSHSREKARQRERQPPREPRRLGGRGRGAERILNRARDARVPRRLGTRSEERARLGLLPSASPRLWHLDGPRDRMCPGWRVPRTCAAHFTTERRDETVARS